MKNRLSGIFTLLLALVVHISFAQQRTVTGTVTDGDGLPLPGVNVLIQGTQTGTMTDFDGGYTINASAGDVLVFTYVGFETVEVTVGTSNNISISLSEDAAQLDEVVVVGYGTATRQSFTGTASVVEGEELARKNVSNVSQALAGESAGVRVINTSGQPGSESQVRIRGIGSVNGNIAPLYVVDGVPFTGSINSINPEDIETTTILKDAAATAIYGARGANGVIVITTRKGRAGVNNIEVTTRTGVNFSHLPRYDVIKSPEEYIGLSWEALYNEGRASGEADPIAFANSRLFSSAGIAPQYNMWNVADGGELIDPATRTVRDGVTRRYNPEDWEDYGFQSSVRNEANLKISGGGDRTRYYTSFGYLHDEGYIIDSDYERYTGRLNVSHEVKDWLTGSVNMGYALSETNNNGQSSDSGSIFWFVDNIPSIYPLFLRDANGDMVEDPIYGGYQYDYGEGRGFGGMTNSIADAVYSGSNAKRHEINTSANLTAKITDWLSFETTFGAQYYNRSYNSLNNPFYGPSASQGGSIYKTKTEFFSYNFLQLLRFNKSFGDHSINALAAHESNSWEQQFLYGSKNNLINPNGTEWNNAVVSPSQPGSYTNDFTLESYFAQVNYDFDDTYFLSLSARRDGSSRFRNDKWDNFYSLGGAWVMSNEDFMADQDVFSNLKLKASYGLIGEQGGVGYYPGYDRFDIGSLGGAPSFSFNTRGNPDLTWETAKMFQVGAEMSFGRFLDVNIDYYRKNTVDLLFERRVAPSTGVAVMNVNDGEMLNSGLEFDVAAHLIQTQDAFLDFRVNGEVVNNELLRMPIEPATGEPKVLDQQGNYGRAEGHSLYDFYMRDYVGVDPADGLAMWKVFYIDADGNGAFTPGEQITSLTQYLADNPDVNPADVREGTTKTYAEATQHYVGKSAFPDVRGAFMLDAGYKGFTISAQFLYQIGGYGYDGAYARLMSNDAIGGNNWHKDIFNRWQEPGDITDVPRLSNDYDANTNGTSTRFLTKTDFLALNNVRIGYDFPKSIVENIGMNQLSIFVSGDNLWLLTERDGFNPSTHIAGSSDMYRYSPLTSITGGVRINF